VASTRFSRALMTRERDFPKACREALRQGYDALDESDIAEICGAVGRMADAPERLCAALTPRWVAPEMEPACVAEFSRYARAGAAPSCDGLAAGAEVLRERCEALRAFRRVRDGGGADACGSSDLCRALDGRFRGPIARLQTRMAAFSCALTSGDALADDHADLVLARAALDSAAAGARAAEARRAPGDRAAAARIDAAAEEISRLQARAQAALTSLPAAPKRAVDPMTAAPGESYP
jgi:hypothetical protein